MLRYIIFLVFQFCGLFLFGIPILSGLIAFMILRNEFDLWKHLEAVVHTVWLQPWKIVTGRSFSNMIIYFFGIGLELLKYNEVSIF